MPDKEQNHQSDFMIEKIKERPINRRKLLRRTIITASMAVIFGLIACVTFLVLEPVISNWLYPEEPPQVVVFPEDQEEMSPEEMLAEKIPAESPSPEPESIVLEEEQIEEILSGVVLDMKSYKELYSAMADYAAELSRYMVVVTSVTSNIDWFNNVQESRNQTAGVIISNNGKELLVLSDASVLKSAESLSVTFFNEEQVNAQIKQIDSYTNLAVLSVALADLPEGMEAPEYPLLGSSNSGSIVGTPIIAMGSPMGNTNSLGYGMITSASMVYSVPDRNYKILQTDIYGSQNASGVLFNLNGQVIGIITGNKTGSDMRNIINAYGITDLRRILEKMSNGDKVAYLGISGISVSAEITGDQDVPVGVFVKDVDMDSPAMMAGIQKGDVITEFDGRSISTFTEYTNALMQLEPEQAMELTVMRLAQEEYKEMKFSIEVGEAK